MKRAFVLTVAMFASLLVFAPSASAGPWDRAECHTDTYVKVCFDPWNDKVWVYDNQRDGASAAARWYTPQYADDRSGRCINSRGFETWRACDYDFQERWKRWDGKRCPNRIYWRNWTVDKSAGWDWQYTSGPYEDHVPYYRPWCI